MKESPRRKARVLALQILYSRAQAGVSLQGERILSIEAGVKNESLGFAREVVNRAWAGMDKIDLLIQRGLKDWKQERLSGSVNALIRLGLSEILFWPETDAKVIINEAMEICKTHVDPEAASLVNGLLHQVAADQKRLP